MVCPIGLVLLYLTLRKKAHNTEISEKFSVANSRSRRGSAVEFRRDFDLIRVVLSQF